MVLLNTTPVILEAISLLPPSALTTLTLPTTTSDPVSHQTLITISHLARKHHLKRTLQSKPTPKTRSDHDTITLNSLLKSTSLYSPPPPAPVPKTPEYLALMAHLKAEQERKTYATLTSTHSQSHQHSLFSNPNTVDQTSPSDTNTDEDNISPSLVLNILLSIVLCAIAVFQLTRYWPNDGVRVLLSLGVALVVGVAEVGVYAAYLRKVSEGRGRERSRREKKVILGEYTGSTSWDAWGTRHGQDAKTETETESSRENMKTEIWGRGVNGGVRRRVREKWERAQADEKETK